MSCFGQLFLPNGFLPHLVYSSVAKECMSCRCEFIRGQLAVTREMIEQYMFEAEISTLDRHLNKKSINFFDHIIRIN